MVNGPFTTYSPAGVYTRTLTDTVSTPAITGLRIPVLIGVGQEELEQLDFSMVRGSSSTLDQQIVSEDVSVAFILDETNPSNPTFGAPNGEALKFRVRNYPLVDGQGFGRVTNDVRSVSVTVNGQPVAVGQVRGQQGTVTLQVPPMAGDNVRVTYFFHRGDTAFTDLVSDQVTTTPASLQAPAVSPYVFDASQDTLILTVDGTSKSIPVAAGSYTAAALKTVIDSQVVTGLATSIETDAQGGLHLTFSAAQSIVVGSGTANGALGLTAGTQTTRNRDFRVYQRPIVDGSDGGLTTTDPTKVVVLVNGSQVAASAVDGTNGVVTLPFAPAAGSVVSVQYWHNTWQDTFDYLPNTMVTQTLRCGFAPGRNDFIVDTDYVVANPSADVSVIHWGASTSIKNTRQTAGTTVLDDTQILATLVDDKLYNVEASRYINNTVVPAVASDREFLLPEVPTLGNGRDTTLGQDLYNSAANGRSGLVSNRPDLLVVRTGRNLRDALNRTPVKVVAVDAENRKITLQAPVPPDHKAYVTQFFSRLSDDTFAITNVTPGPVGVGQFQVASSLQARNLQQVLFGTKAGLSETIQWPRGAEKVPDAYHTGAGTPVSEVVTVTFGTQAARAASYTNLGAAPYGFYASASDQWRTSLNGSTIVTNLGTATKGYLVSSPVDLTGGNITVGAGANVLNLLIDNTPVVVTLTPGSLTPAAIVTAINAAIDLTDGSGSGGVNFVTTAPNLLAATYGIGTDQAVFVIKSFSTPAALPGGFDHVSGVEIAQGTVEATLGYTTFQQSMGSATGLTKPATILGTGVGSFTITAGVDDALALKVDGIAYTVTLPAGTVTAAAAVAAINATTGLSGVASVGTLGNLNKVRLTSQTNGPSSAVEIQYGTANTPLGLTAGDIAGPTLVEAQQVVNSLMGTAGFNVAGVASVATLDGNEYVNITSRTTGLTASSVAFVAGSASAFNTASGTGIVAGTSGDSGEDAHDSFTVTSTNAAGSAGTGIPGQTYTDAQTGLRFSILASQTGTYTNGGSFTLLVSDTWKVNPSIPSLAAGGVELIVTDTVGVGLDDAAQLNTFAPGGQEPDIGDTYYVSYRFMKQDFTTRLYQTFRAVENAFGPVSGENRASLGAYLALQNGAALVGIKQVLKAPNSNQATDSTYIQALKELETPLPGNIRPDVLVALTPSTAVMGALMKHVEVMSTPQRQSERMGFLGFASGTTPTTAQAIAKGLSSNRIVALYPDSVVVTLTDELGKNYEVLVDGTFFAAAVAGAGVSPAVDVATPYTHRKLVGFTRIPRILDPIEANQTAVAGVTILEDLDPIIRIRQGFTTNMANVLTQLPTVTQIADHVQQRSRVTMDPFIGSKFLSSRAQEVEVSMNAMFRGLIGAEIVGAATPVQASASADSPTDLEVAAAFQPVFPLLYIMATFTLRSSGI
jgi:hypothetical protein